MNRLRLTILPLLLLVSGFAMADPIHAIADGAYWHHDSGWVFPERIGDFSLVGIPQDVAGSRHALAYYARGTGDSRTVASVEIYPSDSAKPAEESIATSVVYDAAEKDWKVQIKMTASPSDPGAAAMLDAFVRAQLWDKLGSS